MQRFFNSQRCSSLITLCVVKRHGFHDIMPRHIPLNPLYNVHVIVLFCSIKNFVVYFSSRVPRSLQSIQVALCCGNFRHRNMLCYVTYKCLQYIAAKFYDCLENHIRCNDRVRKTASAPEKQPKHLWRHTSEGGHPAQCSPVPTPFVQVSPTPSISPCYQRESVRRFAQMAPRPKTLHRRRCSSTHGCGKAIPVAGTEGLYQTWWIIERNLLPFRQKGKGHLAECLPGLILYFHNKKQDEKVCKTSL